VYIDGLTISGSNGDPGLRNEPHSQLTATNCVFSNNFNGYGGGIYNRFGDITLINCLLVGNCATYEGGGIHSTSGNLTLINCTLCDNIGGGMNGNPWYTYVTLTNCIFSNNGGTSEYEQIGRGIFTINYSCIQGWTGNLGGIGNIDVDPDFSDPNNGDYHLKSQAGRWDANSESWVTDANTSVAIDAGNPNSDWTAELWPHGKRINMGAYGGTPEASMSQLDIGNIANLDNDVNDIVNSLDLALFVGKWCHEEFLLAEDLNRDGFVNFNDFAIFGLQWSYPTAFEPGMTYQIEDCNREASVSFTAEPPDQTRFTVIVEGLYIHFEDMMVANCCPDELGLEMTVEDNLITIYESEYTPGGCYCICDYPVTATLGPFEPGTYTLEVYEEWSGFIGSTTVVIDPPE
jgi:hypothetical protein